MFTNIELYFIHKSHHNRPKCRDVPISLWFFKLSLLINTCGCVTRSTLVYIYIFSFLELDRRIPNLCAYTVADAYDILKRLMLLNYHYHKNYNCANDKST